LHKEVGTKFKLARGSGRLYAIAATTGWEPVSTPLSFHHTSLTSTITTFKKSDASNTANMISIMRRAMVLTSKKLETFGSL
jgi:hypothetical protein